MKTKVVVLGVFLIFPITGAIISCSTLPVRLPSAESIPAFLKSNGLDENDVISTEVFEDGTVILTIRSLASDILDTVVLAGLSNLAAGPIAAGGAAGGVLIASLVSRMMLVSKIKKGKIRVVEDNQEIV